MKKAKILDYAIVGGLRSAPPMLGRFAIVPDDYPEKVKVYIIGDEKEIFSRELCGGPHVARTGEIGRFKILKEESSSAGVRRIRATID